jgi:hypothetical protein
MRTDGARRYNKELSRVFLASTAAMAFCNSLDGVVRHAS